MPPRTQTSQPQPHAAHARTYNAYKMQYTQVRISHTRCNLGCHVSPMLPRRQRFPSELIINRHCTHHTYRLQLSAHSSPPATRSPRDTCPPCHKCARSEEALTDTLTALASTREQRA